MALAAACTIALGIAPVAAQTRADPPFWTGQPDSAGFAARTAGRIAAARRSWDRLLAVKGRRAVVNTLVPYDDIVRQTDAAGREAGLIREVHPDLLLVSSTSTSA